jgi:hypothetical protein
MFSSVAKQGSDYCSFPAYIKNIFRVDRTAIQVSSDDGFRSLPDGFRSSLAGRIYAYFGRIPVHPVRPDENWNRQIQD